MTVALLCSMHAEEEGFWSQFRRRPLRISQKADMLRCVRGKTCLSMAQKLRRTDVAECHADEASPSKRRRQEQHRPEDLLAFAEQTCTVAEAATSCCGLASSAKSMAEHKANKKQRAQRLCFGQVEVFEVSMWVVKPEVMPGRIVQCDNCSSFFPRRRTKNEGQHAGEKLIHRVGKLGWYCSDCVSQARQGGLTCQSSARELQQEEERPPQSSGTRSAAPPPPPSHGLRPMPPQLPKQARQQQESSENRPAKKIDTDEEASAVHVLKSVSGRLYVIRGSSQTSRNSSDSWTRFLGRSGRRSCSIVAL